MKKFRIVEVTWQDASSYNYWEFLDDLDRNVALLIKTVGFLLDNRKKEIVLARSLTEDNSTEGRFVIPKGWIKKIRTIK